MGNSNNSQNRDQEFPFRENNSQNCGPGEFPNPQKAAELPEMRPENFRSPKKESQIGKSSPQMSGVGKVLAFRGPPTATSNKSKRAGRVDDHSSLETNDNSEPDDDVEANFAEVGNVTGFLTGKPEIGSAFRDMSNSHHRACKCGAVYDRSEHMAEGRVRSAALNAPYAVQRSENWNSAWVPRYQSHCLSDPGC